jgi:DNA primase catalytic core
MRRYNDLSEVKNHLRQSVDLVDLISKYTGETKKQGSRHLTLCPFHSDGNPSFTISPFVRYTDGSMGVWGCFSCGVSGDLFAFVEKIHNIPFFEAINLVAEIYNIDLTQFQRELTPEEQEIENGYNIVEQVADIFSEQLFNSPKELKFFFERGITEDILRTLKVGFCPSLQFIQNYCSGEVLQFIEPCLSNHQRLFGGRLLYPQWTISDRVFGFFARQPDTRATDVPKYIGSSSDGKLFESAGRLYAFAKARKLLRNIDIPLVVVEGFHDVLACQQNGIPAVGLCGNKISKDQIDVLQQHSISKLIVCLDGDTGGQEGMFEFAKKCSEFSNINCSFLIVESEPEDEIRNHGSDNFISRLSSDSISPLDYIIWYKTRFTNINLALPSSKLKLIDEIKPFLLAYSVKSINRELGVSSLSSMTNLSKDSVEDYITETGDKSLVNIQAEMIVLAELALNPQSWITLSKISERDFSLNRFKLIYKIMKEIYTEYAEVSIALLITEASNKKVSEDIISTINKLQGVQRNHVDKFAQEIYEKGIRRQAGDILLRSQRQVKDGLSPITETLSGIVEDITKTLEVKNERRICSSATAIQNTIAEMERRAGTEGGLAGLSLGPQWSWLDSMFSGLQPGRMYAIGAFLGVGKSIVGMNWVHALSVAEFTNASHAAGLIVSMEMTPQENNFRLLAIDSGMPEEFIKKSRYETQEQIDQVINSAERIKKSRLTWMSEQNTVREIAMQARILKSQGNLDYILIDYIQLLDLSPYHSRGKYGKHEEYAEASQDIKNLADSLNVPIIILGQLNRDSQKEDLPAKEHFASSIKFAQDSHAIFLLAKRQDHMIGILDKNRGGGEGQIRLAFDNNPQTSNLRVKELGTSNKIGKV